MYQNILVALENGPADKNVLRHIEQLAKVHRARLLLVHVADGWAARYYEDMQLKESQEMRQDEAYLQRVAADLRAHGLGVRTYLALGDPPTEILQAAERERCDLIAMAAHQHGFLAGLFLGSTIDQVRHKSTRPVLIV